MAISKNRLEELIDKGATIWYVGKDYSVNANRMVDILLGKFNKIENDYLLVKSGDGFHTPRYNFVAYLDELFETRKQAEWHLKYHATRTEELNLPTWEEFRQYSTAVSVSFVGEDWRVYELSNDIDIFHKPRIILTDNEVYFKEWEKTEENYIKACDLCLKLFEEEQKC